MATLGNNKIQGLSFDEVTSSNNAVSKSYADSVLPPATGNAKSILLKKPVDDLSSAWSSNKSPDSMRVVFSGVDLNEELFVIMGCSPSQMYASTDNINWTARTSSYTGGGTSTWADGGWLNGYWYRVQSDYLGFSTDSIHWSTRTTGNGSGFNPGYSDYGLGSCRMFYKEPYYYTSNWSNQLWSSTDTIIWEQRTHNGSTVYSLGCHNGTVLYGSSNNLTTTTDWYHWSYRTTPNCGNIYSMSSVGDYVFLQEADPYSGSSSPYPVKVNLSTDTIHWERRDTGYRTYCTSWLDYPTTMAYSDGKYYTHIKSALGSGTCCRPLIISSTDAVVWETELDGCNSNTRFDCGAYNRIQATANGVVFPYCCSSFCGYFTCGGGGKSDKEWINISDSEPNVPSRRGSVTLDSNSCTFFSYTFPKETQYISFEAQLEGSVATCCPCCSTSNGIGGGRGGQYIHFLSNKCDNVIADNTGQIDSQFNMSICGSTLASNFSDNLGPIIGSDDMESFYSNAFLISGCFSSCHAKTISSGFDSSGNEVIFAGCYDLRSSLDGGRTWSMRTGVQYVCHSLYIDGCRGNFWGAFGCRLCHSTDTIHWTCKPSNHRNNCLIHHLSYQNSAYWIAGCGFLSCSPDGTTWTHRTVSCCNFYAFGYDSSGGYLLGDCQSNLRASTDSIHWTNRSNQQCCYTGFKYCNSKWYSFGRPSAYSGPSCKSSSWPINQSTDTIHWEGACCLPILGSDYHIPDCMASVHHCTLGPNNEVILSIVEPTTERMLPYYAECQHNNGATQTLKSSTDFIHWIDYSKKLPNYHLQQQGCYMALCYGCITDIHYSSDTGRYLQSSCCTCQFHQQCNCAYNVYANAFCSRISYGSVIYGDYIDVSACSMSYCTKCSSSCPDYFPSSCAFGSSASIRGSRGNFRTVMGGDFPIVDGSKPGFPGVTCHCKSMCGLDKGCYDIGVSGASSGGSSSAFGPGGGVCSPLGNIPTTDIDHSELKQYEITVSANGSSNYTLAGEDRGGTFSATSNKSITIKSGDLVAFTLDATVSGHPFWIKKVNSTGDEDRILAKFVENNGADSGEIILDTYKMKPGTYHYNCQFHSGMHGTITVERPVVNLDGEDGVGSNYSLFGTGGSAGYIYKSGFGVWFSRTSAQDGGCDRNTKLAYGNGIWMHSGCSGIDTSTDSIHWTLRTIGMSCDAAICGAKLIYGNSTWIANSSIGPQTASSTDTIHWTLRTIGTECSGNTSGTAFGDNMFMVKKESTITVSTDAIHWKMRTVGACLCSGPEHEGIAYGNGMWATVHSSYNGGMFASTDTIHWQARTHGLGGWYVYVISYANGYWFENGESCMSISTDTIAWTNKACMASPPTMCSPVVYSNGRYMYGARNGCWVYREGLVATYDACQTWSYLNDKFGSYVNDDIKGAAVSDTGQALFSDGHGIHVMSNERSRLLIGDGGNGCNGGGAGASAQTCNSSNSWMHTGRNGQPGDRKIRITWW